MKIRVNQLLLGLGAVILVVGSGLTWRALRVDPEQAAIDEGLDRLRSKSGAKSGANDRPRFIRPRGAFSSDASKPDEVREGWAEAELPRVGDPGELGPEEAVDNFKAAIAELEAAVEADGRLSAAQEAELYERATGSFTALSSWIDGADASDRAVLDDAYGQMMALMRQLDLDPPERNPDGVPIRR